MSPANIFFWGALAFLFGIVAESFGWNFFIYLFIPLVIAILTCSFFSYKQNMKPDFLKLTWKLSFLLTACVFLGAFYYQFYVNLLVSQEKIIFNKNTEFSGIIVKEPLVSEKYQSFELELKEPLRGNITVLTDPLTDFNYGDVIQGFGKIQEGADLQNPASFFPKIEILDHHQGFWLKERLINFKKYLVSQYRGILGSDEATLLSGITFGYVSGSTKEFKNQMALSGTTHLVALSGYNISILVIAISLILGNFLSRRKTFYLTILAIALFVIMVGAEASIVRAAIMGFLVLFARELGRAYSVRNSIILAALLMVILDPRVLIFNIGFQLSFLSLLGIVYLEPVLKKLLKSKFSRFGGFGDAAIITISAQIAVFPIIVLGFGQFSLSGIPANILILGFVPITMLFGLLLAIVAAINVYLGFALAKLTELLLIYQISVIKFFANHSLLISFGGSWFISLIYYVALVLIVYKFSPLTNEKS